jgi:hypothetical protein
MALASRLFAGNKELEAAATSNPAHIQQGARGVHVSKIQGALQALDDAAIDIAEIEGRIYGKSTADAVLAYKRKRDIVNRSYQQSADNVTGIMTVERMDRELKAAERTTRYVPLSPACGHGRQVSAPAGAGGYDQAVMPMSDAEMIACLQRGTSKDSQDLVAKLEGGQGPLIAGRGPAMPARAALPGLPPIRKA